MKICNKYYLSVEGETEKWYFEHLQDLINNNEVIDDYKEERNFKRILTKINLDNVITAVKNGNEIRKMNEENAEGKGRICGKFKYYIDNPDMTINECVELILKECGAIK